VLLKVAVSGKFYGDRAIAAGMVNDYGVPGDLPDFPGDSSIVPGLADGFPRVADEEWL
jgi:hypothetical protein